MTGSPDNSSKPIHRHTWGPGEKRKGVGREDSQRREVQKRWTLLRVYQSSFEKVSLVKNTPTGEEIEWNLKGIRATFPRPSTLFFLVGLCWDGLARKEGKEGDCRSVPEGSKKK